MTEYQFSRTGTTDSMTPTRASSKFSSAYLHPERWTVGFKTKFFRGRNCEQVTSEGLVTFFCLMALIAEVKRLSTLNGTVRQRVPSE